MRPTQHTEYLSHLSSQIVAHRENRLFWEQLSTYAAELSLLIDLSLDPVREALDALYCPTGNGSPRDPSAMLRSWLLMTRCREGSPTVWATRLTREPVLSILAGFAPGDAAGATTHRDFLTRLLDGPYAIRSKQDIPLSHQLRGRHRRRLDDATKARRAEADAHGKTLSAHLCDTLLATHDQPRHPHDLQTRLDHLFSELGLKPTLAAKALPPGDLTVAGDGTVEPSAASNDGTRACACPPGSRCGCPRDYLSKTAQFCYDKQHGYRFGDRSYTISTTINGHDIPLMTIMGTGNESDFTLSLKALDRLLKLLEEDDIPVTIRIFIGDGHHDASGIYRYLAAKGIVPVIPLDEASPPTGAPAATPPEPASTTTPADDPPPAPTTSSRARTRAPRPQIAAYPQIPFEQDGTPLCPGGCRMRYQQYNANRQAHIFACPCTRKNGQRQWVFHAQECPFQQDCTPPEKKMGYTLYIKSEADRRLLPPIPRDSARFNALYAKRSGTERQNAVADSYKLDRRHRHAAYVLIRLTFVNICKHARIRQQEGGETTPQAQVQTALNRLDLRALRPN